MAGVANGAVAALEGFLKLITASPAPPRHSRLDAPLFDGISRLRLASRTPSGHHAHTSDQVLWRCQPYRRTSWLTFRRVPFDAAARPSRGPFNLVDATGMIAMHGFDLLVGKADNVARAGLVRIFRPWLPPGCQGVSVQDGSEASPPINHSDF